MAAKEGAKLDQGKSRIDLIPPEFILALGDVLGDACSPGPDGTPPKYDERNWELGFDWGRAYAAAQRHLLAWAMGEDTNPDTGLSHLAHAATNMAFLIAFARRGVGRDDRSPHYLQDRVKPVITTGLIGRKVETIIVDDPVVATAPPPNTPVRNLE